jgi:hypothetical protein
VTWQRVDHTLTLRVVFLAVRAALKIRGACLGVSAAGAALLGSARRRTVQGEAGTHSGERFACVHWFPRRARCCAWCLSACAGWGLAWRGWCGAHASFAERGCSGAALVSELPCPGRRSPRRFPVASSARSRCGACLCAPAARRGSFGLGAALGTSLGVHSERLAAGVHWILRALLRSVLERMSRQRRAGLGSACAGCCSLPSVPYGQKLHSK